MLDVDHFKNVNDTHGHNAGDQVLCAIASILHEEESDEDIVARWGGEEFALLLPQLGGDKAAILAERVRAHIARIEMPGISNAVTVSSGVATFPLHASSKDKLSKLADAALYEAKRLGRNRVCTANVSAQLEE